MTHNHVHMDRTDCPWLMQEFVDHETKCIFVPEDEVEKTATKTWLRAEYAVPDQAG